MHVLHLIDAIARPPAPVTLGLIADLIGAQPAVDHRACVLGPVIVADSAQAAGLHVDDHLPTGPGSRWRAWWNFRRYLRSPGGSHPQIIHAWSSHGHALARRLARQSRVLYTPSIEPGLDLARLRSGSDRRALRMRWGVTDEKTFVVVVLGDDVRQIDAMTGMMGGGLAMESGRNVRVLMSPHTAALPRAMRVTIAAGNPHLVTTDESVERPWEVLAGCDLAVVLGGTLCAAWAMAAGVPIIAPGGGATDAILSNQTAVLTRPRSMGDIGRVVCELIDDPARREALVAAARAQATGRFDLGRFAGEMGRLYASPSSPPSIRVA